MDVDETATGQEAEIAVTRLLNAWQVVSAAEDAVPQPGPFRRRARMQALHNLDGAQRDFRAAFAGVTRARVGSLPLCWGLLSDDVEQTLERYVEFDPKHAIGPELRAMVEHIQSELFAARIHAHNGDRALEQSLTDELARCLDLESRPERARRLLHHLPGSKRPIPEVDLGAARRALRSRGVAPFAEGYFHYMDVAVFGQSCVVHTFSVSFKTADTLELHDIIVGSGHEESRQPHGRGLGTAALQHLCRSADRYGLNIVGKIMPGDRTEHSAARLANWYVRNQFTVTQQTEGQFLWAALHRKPLTF